MRLLYFLFGTAICFGISFDSKSMKGSTKKASVNPVENAVAFAKAVYVQAQYCKPVIKLNYSTDETPQKSDEGSSSSSNQNSTTEQDNVKSVYHHLNGKQFRLVKDENYYIVYEGPRKNKRSLDQNHILKQTNSQLQQLCNIQKNNAAIRISIPFSRYSDFTPYQELLVPIIKTILDSTENLILSLKNPINIFFSVLFHLFKDDLHPFERRASLFANQAWWLNHRKKMLELYAIFEQAQTLFDAEKTIFENTQKKEDETYRKTKILGLGSSFFSIGCLGVIGASLLKKIRMQRAAIIGLLSGTISIGLLIAWLKQPAYKVISKTDQHKQAEENYNTAQKKYTDQWTVFQQFTQDMFGCYNAACKPKFSSSNPDAGTIELPPKTCASHNDFYKHLDIHTHITNSQSPVLWATVCAVRGLDPIGMLNTKHGIFYTPEAWAEAWQEETTAAPLFNAYAQRFATHNTVGPLLPKNEATEYRELIHILDPKVLERSSQSSSRWNK